VPKFLTVCLSRVSFFVTRSTQRSGWEAVTKAEWNVFFAR